MLGFMRMPIGVRFFYVFICFMNTYCLLVHIVSQNTYPKGKKKNEKLKGTGTGRRCCNGRSGGCSQLYPCVQTSMGRLHHTALHAPHRCLQHQEGLKGWLCGFLCVLAVPAFPGHHRRTFRLGTYPCNAHRLHSA